MLRITGLLSLLLLPGLLLGPLRVQAEAVEIRHAGGVGAGYTFRRGQTCTVLTAAHVVAYATGPIEVLDKSGAKAGAQVTYSNEAYDLALLALPDNPPVACTSAWPDGGLKTTRFTSKTEFEAVRHYPDGREALILLRYAGGTPQKFTLAPADKRRIVESDSGTIVLLDGEYAGIVQAVLTDEDRVEVLRFDTIDQLVGDRFRRLDGAPPLSFAGVFQNNRQHANWTTYIQSWLTERAGRMIVPQGNPLARCNFKVDVVSWDRASEPNPEYAQVQEQLKNCTKRGWLWEQMCAAAKRREPNTPRTVMVHKLMLNITMAPPDGPAAVKLASRNYVPPPALGSSGPQLELAVLQTAVGDIAGDMFEAGACQ